MTAAGWIGLGEMGVPMVGRVVAAGHHVAAFDRDPSRLAAAAAVGAEAAASLADLLAVEGPIVVMVRTAAQVEAVLTDLAAGAGDGGADVVVMSTVPPALMRRLAAETAGRLRVLDAPVSGGVRGAEAGSLAIMASGPAEALALAEPLLSVLGARTFVLGSEPGLGQAAKAANQLMMAVAIAGTTEGLALARANGLSEEEAIAAVSASTGSSWVLEHWDWMRSLWESYEPGNGLEILVKDVRALLEEEGELPVLESAFAALKPVWRLA